MAESNSKLGKGKGKCRKPTTPDLDLDLDLDFAGEFSSDDSFCYDCYDNQLSSDDFSCDEECCVQRSACAPSRRSSTKSKGSCSTSSTRSSRSSCCPDGMCQMPKKAPAKKKRAPKCESGDCMPRARRSSGGSRRSCSDGNCYDGSCYGYGYSRSNGCAGGRCPRY